MEKVNKNIWYQNPASYFIALLAIYGLWIVFDTIKLRFSVFKSVDVIFPLVLVFTLVIALVMLLVKSSKKRS